MILPATLPVSSPDVVAEKASALAAQGIDTVIGTFVNPAGVLLAKALPVERLAAFHTSGLGASPTWNVFCIDGAIAFTPDFGVVEDLRLRLDLDAVRPLAPGLAWGPLELFTQAGEVAGTSARSLLRRTQSGLEGSGLSALVGHELEFVLTGPDGEAYERLGWTPYGAGPLLEQQALVRELLAAAAEAGVPIEQFHAEYAPGQFEFSLPPKPPLQSADDAVFARLLVGEIARRHGLRASFSPFPFAGGGGSGAHLHFSLADASGPLFAGGDGPHGITSAGGAAIGGVIQALPGLQGVLTGSVLSGARLQPGYWSGAFACWGRENREAAVRFIVGGSANPAGSNVEVKSVDPSANVYATVAGVLEAALRGIRAQAPLPPEVTVNPAELDDAQRAASGTVLLPAEQSAALDALAASPLTPELLSPAFVSAVLAVRRHELEAYGAQPIEQTAPAFRFAWSA